MAASQWLRLPAHLLCRVRFWYTLPRISCCSYPLLNSYSPSRCGWPNSKMEMPWWRAVDSNCFCEEGGESKLSHLKFLPYFCDCELTRQTCSTAASLWRCSQRDAIRVLPAVSDRCPTPPGLNSSLAFITNLCFSVCVPRQNSLIQPVSESPRAI